MYQITDFTKRCVYNCYVLMKKCVDFEHIEDSEFVLSTFKLQILLERYAYSEIVGTFILI